MNVAELIEKLRTMPQDAEVWCAAYESTDAVTDVQHEPEHRRWSGAEPSNVVVLL